MHKILLIISQITQLIVFLYLVTIKNYEGYWIQTPMEKTMFCSMLNDSVLNCETERCTTNCYDTYEVENIRIISIRDLDTMGNYSWDSVIQWGNNVTWTQRG